MSDVEQATGKTRRVQMDMGMTSYDRLAKLKDATEASSFAEVMKNALRLYEYVLNEEGKGSTFGVKEKDGTLTAVKLF